MRKLNLDFQAIARPNAWAGWLLLLVGMLFCADVFWGYISLKDEIAKNHVMPHVKIIADPVRASAKSEQLIRQYEQALDAVDSLAFPWAALFAALESVPTTDIGILEFTPHPQEHLLVLRGEAANFAAMLTYIAGLEQTPIFYDVYLDKHELKKGGQANSIAFTLSAYWVMP